MRLRFECNNIKYSKMKRTIVTSAHLLHIERTFGFIFNTLVFVSTVFADMIDIIIVDLQPVSIDEVFTMIPLITTFLLKPETVNTDVIMLVFRAMACLFEGMMTKRYAKI